MQDNLLSYAVMPIHKQTDFGKINISNKAITGIVKDAAMECYGVVGIYSKNSSEEELEKNIIVKTIKSKIEISLYIIIAYGVKITEVLSSVQKKVKYVVEKTFDVSLSKVNVYAQEIEKVE